MFDDQRIHSDEQSHYVSKPILSCICLLLLLLLLLFYYYYYYHSYYILYYTASSPKHSPCNIHPAITMRFTASHSKPTLIYARGNIKWRQSSSHSNAICNQRFKNRIERHTQTQPLVAKHIGGTIRAWNDRSRTRRTHEVPFIAGCSHFTRKNTRFRAPASSPKHSPCNIHAAITMRFTASRSKPASIYTRGNIKWRQSSSYSNAICNQRFKNRIERHTQTQPLVAKHIGGTIRAWNDRSRTFTRKNTRFHAPASSRTHHLPSPPLPFLTTSLPHHSPSSSLPFFTTSLPHHSPSSPLPFLTTSLPHHSPSSSLPFFTTSLPHHFPSLPLPFRTTSLPHHFPSSPLPIVTTSHRHHFPSSPLPIVPTPSLSAPFIKVNSTASYSFVMYWYVMYCYTIYRPSSFQISEFYLSVTRKYCLPTSFDYNPRESKGHDVDQLSELLFTQTLEILEFRGFTGRGSTWSNADQHRIKGLIWSDYLALSTLTTASTQVTQVLSLRMKMGTFSRPRPYTTHGSWSAKYRNPQNPSLQFPVPNSSSERPKIGRRDEIRLRSF